MANNFKNAFGTSIGTTQATATSVYTANVSATPLNSILIEMDACNTSTTTLQFSAMIYDSSSTSEYHIIKNAPIPAGGTLKVVDGQKIVLNGDDEIRVYASAANVDVIVSILEDVT
jgi:hypothetical protein